MVFNSLTYLLLLFFVVFIFWNISNKLRYYLIFLSSLIFYGFWRIDFIFLLLFSTTLDWFFALKIFKSEDYVKKRYLFLSLFINLTLLFYFKYLIFFAENTIGFLNLLGVGIDPFLLKIILPLGISFYTFQTISYVIDVYRGSIKPEKNYIIYSSYVTFFPQLVAGPILRANEVIPQFKKKNLFKWKYINEGLRRILYGLFLKVVLADNIAPLVNSGFDLPLETLSALDVWTLAFLFGIQIYFDFSGYSHIALGSAKMIGITLPENFNFPYISSSPKDFWRRWHISLSSWVRDYIYLPLLNSKYQDSSSGGFSKTSIGNKDQKPLFITWTLMGLWHGANWTFLLWGLYHALAIYIYRSLLKINKKLKIKPIFFIGCFFTTPIMMLAWIPFRAESIGDTVIMWSKILNPLNYFSLNLRENTYIVTLILIVGMTCTYFLREYLKKRKNRTSIFLNIWDTVIISFIFGTCFIFLRPINQFIYFQF